jgi:hypothetical protein
MGGEDAESREALSKPPTWETLFALECRILRLQTDDELRLRAPSLRARLRNIVGDADYEILAKAFPPSDDADAARLRSELNYIMSEIYLRYATTGARENNRTHIMVNVILFSFCYVLVLTVIFMFVSFLLGLGAGGMRDGEGPVQTAVRQVTGREPSPTVGRSDKSTNTAQTTATSFFLDPIWTAYVAAVLGCIGAYVSLQNRLQSLPYEGDAIFRMISVNRGWLSIYLSPISGSIFALLAYLLFAAQFVRGDLFPEFAPPHAQTDASGLRDLTQVHLHDLHDYPKLFIWSFIVGFAERLVPDALNRIIQTRKDKIVDLLATPPTPAPLPTSTADEVTSPARVANAKHPMATPAPAADVPNVPSMKAE